MSAQVQFEGVDTIHVGEKDMVSNSTNAQSFNHTISLNEQYRTLYSQFKIFFSRALLKVGWGLLFILVINGPVSAQTASVSYRHSQRPPTAEELMQWHEVFTYEVQYSFFKLGEVKVEVVPDAAHNGQKMWKLRTVITSNASIPLVGEEENVYTSVFSIIKDMFQVQEFWTDNRDENELNTSHYFFDRKNDAVYAHEKDQPTDTLALEEPGSSGHIIFLQGRTTAGTDSVLKVPVYLNQEIKYLTLTNTKKTAMREYDAFPGKVKTYYTKGYTDIDGPFGFSGEFESWYLADDLRVPVEARVKVWIGHAKIKLKDYKKEKRK